MNEFVLLRYFNNELNDEEIAAVESWIMSSDENRTTAQHYYHVCLAAESLNREERTLAALASVKSRIGFKKARKSPTTPLWFRHVAAALLLISLSFAGWYMIGSGISGRPHYIEVRMSPGMTGHIELPDGSEVWLNSNSYLKYPARFTGDNRTVVLDGEAYFAVKKDNGKKFTVNTEKVSIRVLGTAFNVDAYGTSKFITATLAEGSVSLFYKDRDCNEQNIVMQPGEQTVYNKETRAVRLNRLSSLQEIAWKDGNIVWRSTPLKDALLVLGKRFNVDFVVKNESLYHHSFTGSFKNQDLDCILEHLKISSDIQYKIRYFSREDSEVVRKTVELY